MGWVLILTLSWTNPAMTAIIVPTKEDCYRIGDEFLKEHKDRIYYAYYQCIEEHK